ncbi:MAG: S-layer homology domain-containing protein [Gammaproteobacteria bacterium]|nr:S-layer homology domain-containing protein [Gammaproteobacteria bacterium]
MALVFLASLSLGIANVNAQSFDGAAADGSDSAVENNSFDSSPVEIRSAEDKEDDLITNQFGISRTFVHTTQVMGGCGPISSTTAYNFGGSQGRLNVTSGSAFFECGFYLPTGSKIVGFELEACDSSTSDTVNARLYRYASASASLSTLAFVESGTTSAPGCTYFYTAVSNHTVENFNGGYMIEFYDGSTLNTTTVRAARVYWQRQISPAPGSATFLDVPTSHPFFKEVEALAASGISGGCGDGTIYCPNNPVTRGQMAAFLARALGLYWSP